MSLSTEHLIALTGYTYLEQRLVELFREPVAPTWVRMQLLGEVRGEQFRWWLIGAFARCTTSMSNWDKQAVAILTSSTMTKSQKDSALAALARAAKAELNNEFPCPECGHQGPHEDNGGRGYNLSYCCCACGNHWDAVQQ